MVKFELSFNPLTSQHPISNSPHWLPCCSLYISPPPPPRLGNPQAFHCHLYKFIPIQIHPWIWTGSGKSFQQNMSVISLNMEHYVGKKKITTEIFEIGWQLKFLVKIVPFPYLPHHDYTSMTMCLLVHQEYYH